MNFTNDVNRRRTAANRIKSDSDFLGRLAQTNFHLLSNSSAILPMLIQPTPL